VLEGDSVREGRQTPFPTWERCGGALSQLGSRATSLHQQPADMPLDPSGLGRSARGAVCFGVAAIMLSWGLVASAQGQAKPEASTGQSQKPTPPAPSSGAPQTADEAFELKAKALEEQINDLKEKILRTKSRLLLLQEAMVGGTEITSGAKAVLLHRNEMGGNFVLESVSYALDGAPIFTKVDVNGDLDKKEEFEIFNGRIVPGQHQINVKMNYRGHGYGVFSYLEGYKFAITGNYTFNAEPGKVTTVKIVGFEAGGFTTDIKDRPKVRYEISQSKDQAVKKDGAAPPQPQQ
jgi:hypothetical protein